MTEQVPVDGPVVAVDADERRPARDVVVLREDG